MENVIQPSYDKNRRKKNYKKRNRKNSSKNKKNFSGGKDLLPNQNKVTPRSSLPPIDIKKVKEPLEKCAYCNKVIKNIASAIKGENEYYHFDCVLDKIKKENTIKDGQLVSYIGRGAFAIIEKDEEGKIKFVETIQFEDPKQFDAMKKYVEEIKI
ncbi:MAG: hypothetical protein ACPKM0_07305 [Pleomorphochaeta sp.]